MLSGDCVGYRTKEFVGVLSVSQNKDSGFYSVKWVNIRDLSRGVTGSALHFKWLRVLCGELTEGQAGLEGKELLRRLL